MPLNQAHAKQNPVWLYVSPRLTELWDGTYSVSLPDRGGGKPRLYGKVAQETFTPLSSTLSRIPVAASRISLSTLRFDAMPSASGMEIILFPRNAAMRPNPPRSTMSTPPGP